MKAQDVKVRRYYVTDNRPEVVQVVGRETIHGETWFKVRFLDGGGHLMTHPSRLVAEA